MKRRFTQVVSTLVIGILPFLNIIRIDIPTLRFYFLNTVLWVEEFYFLFLFFMFCVWVILTFSMLYGRVWCGWMCPQMTLVEFTLWLRSALCHVLKLDPEERSPINCTVITIATACITGMLGFCIGFILVSYFNDPYAMIADLLSGQIDPIALGCIVGIGILVFIDLMFWRETFCAKACPYAMLQMVMTDDNTQIVRYHTGREHECIQCHACVRACIMKIDIRKSPYQTECIHCGDCVDACATVRSCLDNPSPSLISFTWGENQKDTQTPVLHKLGLFDAKRWILVSLALIFFSALIILSQIRQPLAASIAGDRLTLYRTGDAGEIINDYILKITNRSIEREIMKIVCPEHLTCTSEKEIQSVALDIGETRKIGFSIHARDRNLHPGPNTLKLRVQSLNNTRRKIEEEIVFFMPERG
ncbi:MAG: 4Fe-4S binding protein [bacterium]|nr:4Fe-4S binding protein [bacterium]